MRDEVNFGGVIFSFILHPSSFILSADALQH
jgi:hypothetical protein